MAAELEIRSDTVTFRPPLHLQYTGAAEEEAFTLSVAQTQRSKFLSLVIATSLEGPEKQDDLEPDVQHAEAAPSLQLNAPLHWESLKLWLQHARQVQNDSNPDEMPCGLRCNVNIAALKLYPSSEHSPVSSDPETTQHAVLQPAHEIERSRESSASTVAFTRSPVLEEICNSRGIAGMCDLMMVRYRSHPLLCGCLQSIRN